MRPHSWSSQIKDVDWDADLGANLLDTLLAEHFAKAFAEKHKLKAEDALTNPKSMAKMKKQVNSVLLCCAIICID